MMAHIVRRKTYDCRIVALEHSNALVGEGKHCLGAKKV